MCIAGQPCEVGWAEPLPDGCPPSTASNAGAEVIFRFFKGESLTAEHFWSHRKLGKVTGNAPECEAHSVSMVSTLQKAIARLPLQRWRGHKIAQVTLVPGAGVLLDKKQPSGHIDWWPCGAHPPLAAAKVVA